MSEHEKPADQVTGQLTRAAEALGELARAARGPERLDAGTVAAMGAWRAVQPKPAGQEAT